MHFPIQVAEVAPITSVPDGEYVGAWSGFAVTFAEESGRVFILTMNQGKPEGTHC